MIGECFPDPRYYIGDLILVIAGERGERRGPYAFYLGVALR